MSPYELVILTTVEENEGLGIQHLTHATDIVGPPLRHICDSLCRRGYIKRKNPEQYQVTCSGQAAIIEAQLGDYTMLDRIPLLG